MDVKWQAIDVTVYKDDGLCSFAQRAFLRNVGMSSAFAVQRKFGAVHTSGT